MSAASEREASFRFGGAKVWREGGSLFLTFMGMRREFRPAEWQAIQAFLGSEAPRQPRAMADLFDTKDGVCLTCGGGVLNDGSHIDPARHDAEIQAEALREVDEFLDWLISMDDPDDEQGMDERRVVTLTRIIGWARRIREGGE